MQANKLGNTHVKMFKLRYIKKCVQNLLLGFDVFWVYLKSNWKFKPNFVSFPELYETGLCKSNLEISSNLNPKVLVINVITFRSYAILIKVLF